MGDEGADPDKARPLPTVREARYSRSLERGLAILGCFTPDQPLLSIAELARRLSISRPTMHRYVTTLVSLGYLEQDASRKYRLGLGTIDLGAGLNAMGLCKHTRPHLEELTQRSGYTTVIAVLDGLEILIVDNNRTEREVLHRDVPAAPGKGLREIESHFRERRHGRLCRYGVLARRRRHRFGLLGRRFFCSRGRRQRFGAAIDRGQTSVDETIDAGAIAARIGEHHGPRARRLRADLGLLRLAERARHFALRHFEHHAARRGRHGRIDRECQPRRRAVVGQGWRRPGGFGADDRTLDAEQVLAVLIDGPGVQAEILRERYGLIELALGDGKVFRCPGCDQEIVPGTPHIVAWPADGARMAGGIGVEERRHWHTTCWQNRLRRGPGVRRRGNP